MLADPPATDFDDDRSPSLILDELETGTVPAFNAFYRRLSSDQRKALLDFARLQERGERGPLIDRVLELSEADQQRYLYFLGLLSRDEKAVVADLLQNRETGRWEPLFRYLEVASPEEVRKTVLFTGGARYCPETYLIDGQPGGAPFECTEPSKNFLLDWNRSVQRLVRADMAEPGVERWQAQILLTDKGYNDRISASVLADIRRVTKFTANRWENAHICGAVNLGEGWVLTAAHCLTNHFNPDSRVFDELQVRLGARRLSTGGTRHAIDAVVIHAAYSSEYGGKDIALLRIKGAGRQLPPVSIFDSNPSLARGNKALVSGWGYTGESTRGSNLLDVNNKAQRLSEYLQQAELSLLPRTRCNGNAKFRSRGYSIGTGQLCVGDDDGGSEDSASCRGDSGGPLVDRSRGGVPRLLGVVSYAPGCALKGVPTVYTDVSHYALWVRNAKRAAVTDTVVRMNDQNR